MQQQRQGSEVHTAMGGSLNWPGRSVDVPCPMVDTHIITDGVKYVIRTLEIQVLINLPLMYAYFAHTCSTVQPAMPSLAGC